MNESEFSRYSLLAEVAELYYLKGLQQAEIAAKMVVSRSLVSRMISEAQEKGIVSITINHYFRRNNDLEKDLCSKYDIEDAGVLSLPQSMESADIKVQLGRFAADLIYGELCSGTVVGFTFGTTLQRIVEALSLKPAKNLTAVQLSGSLGAAESAFDAHELVHKLSSVWNCDAVFLHAPFIVNSDEIRDHLYRSRSNSLNAEMCLKLDAAVVGLSSFDARGDSALYSGGHLSGEDFRLMRKNGIIGDVGTFSLNKTGNLVEVDTLTRMTGLNEKEWKKVKKRYGIAFGENKIEIIKAALSGGWLTHLITDEATAGML